MTDELHAAFLAASRLPPAQQLELAGRLLCEVATLEREAQPVRLWPIPKREPQRRTA